MTRYTFLFNKRISRTNVILIIDISVISRGLIRFDQMENSIKSTAIVKLLFSKNETPLQNKYFDSFISMPFQILLIVAQILMI